MSDFNKKREKFLQKILENVGQAAVFSKLHSSPEESEIEIKALKNLVKDYCELDEDYKLNQQTLQEVEEFYDNSETVSSVPVEEKFQELYLKNKTTYEDFSTHPFMVNFLKKLEETKLESDTDNLSEEFIIPTDPVTKQPIKNPVKNTKCGHIYEDESIRKLLLIKKQTRCPYIGCPALQYIQISNLVADKELKRKIDSYNLKH